MTDTKKLKNEVYKLLDKVKKHNNNEIPYNVPNTTFTNQMKEKYNYLYTNSLTLFERCLKNDLNLEQFEYMMRMIDKINNGSDYNKTSIEVGQKLADIYIHPVINKN